ncbi:MAG: hypothetical protein U1E29_17640 [Coriobacteriia bacterium]|nr:hypothetical protein [Coriobacteriia bacterium]
MGAMRQSFVEAGLKKKGFEPTDHKHRQFVFMTDSGRKTPVKTMTSHGSDKVLSSSLVCQMARQCKLSVKEFERMVSCRIPREQYAEMLRLQGVDIK